MASKQLFIKKNAVGTWGSFPEERITTELFKRGIINIDKPKGPTSHQVSDYVQKILSINKAGHSGTLDPQVTGVQPIGLGKATRIMEFFLKAPKEYVGIMHLHKDATRENVENAIQHFIGKIKQLPPIKSAVKRQLREREIYEFEILEIKEKDILFRIKCQAGTYVRKYCHDLGQAIGTGAHMAELRRTQAGPFTERDNLVTLNDVQDGFYLYKHENDDSLLRQCIQPVEHAIRFIPQCWILDTTIPSVSHGREVAIPGIAKLENFRKGETVVILSLKGELIAIGEALLSAVDISTKEKGLALKVERVFIDQIVTSHIVTKETKQDL